MQPAVQHYLNSTLASLALPTAKAAALRPEVQLQSHQQRISDAAASEPLRMLLLHALGSGKSLSGIAAAEARKGPYTAIAPAALRPNYRKEIAKFTDSATPADVLSYTELAQGKEPDKLDTLIFDEAHRMRNPQAAQTQRAMAAAEKAKQLILLSGTPLVNSPGDLATPLAMLTGEKMTPEEFEARYTTRKPVYDSWLHWLVGSSSGHKRQIDRADELKEKLKGKVDYYDPGKPVVPTTYEDVPVEMSDSQARIYDAMWDKIPWYLRWKLQNDSDMTAAELRRTRAFLTGPRQVGLSTYAQNRSGGPLKAFEKSPKLQTAYEKLQETLKDDRAKALVFANYIDAGLMPYAAALERAGIPHAVFSGKLSDADRKKLVDDYNANKIRVALLGPSGTEGLSFKGTQLVQLLDPSYNSVRPRQAVGRGLRFDSHSDLPPELQNVRVQRFLSRVPLGWTDKLLSWVGLDRSRNQLGSDDYLTEISKNKEQLNNQFIDLLKEVGQTR